jgi:hypothetical protein
MFGKVNPAPAVFFFVQGTDSFGPGLSLLHA